VYTEWVVQVKRCHDDRQEHLVETSWNHKLLGFFNDDRDLVTHGHVKESLSETRRPDFISTFVFTVSPDLPQPTHRLEEEDTLRGILFLRLKSSHFFFEGLPVGEYLLGDPML
jgi:hypothetical protein